MWNILSYTLIVTNIKSRMKYFQVFLLVLANLVVMYTSNSIDMGQGLPLLSQCASWIILILTWILPLAEEKALSLRGTTVVTGLFTLYLLMSTSYELWFLLCLILFLYCWNKKELSGSNLSSLSVDFTSRSIVEHQISMDDVRTSFIYLLSITLAFFGTGNIASLNSFEPASMFCFLTVFNPFSMAALLLLKVIIPFIVVACGFHIITSQTGTKQDGVFLIILLMSDLMGMHFFMWVQDYGSWLDIGTSISHYVITLVTTLVLIILSKFSQFIMTYCILPAKYYKSFSHKHS
ncbi:PIGN [Bugula neritina]|uniref:GPI ethanolamine phosphate transferase 1 n=1 Tax=Bugula neritina TaxID=10212 RepID=A0A7J7JZD7_BUGNE|nr:PIGN [Bugula neritina]